jgi:hypothetical protein
MKKSFFASMPKQVIILGFVSLFTDFASEMLYPVMPIFLVTYIGASMGVIGIIEGAAELTAGLLKGFLEHSRINWANAPYSFFWVMDYPLLLNRYPVFSPGCLL